MAIIYPVILPVPAAVRALPGRERTKLLSALARDALFESAKKAAFPLIVWTRTIGERRFRLGAFTGPSPIRRPMWPEWWPRRRPVGIDVEAVKPVSDALYGKTGTPEEWALGGEDPPGETLWEAYWGLICDIRNVFICDRHPVCRLMPPSALHYRKEEPPFPLCSADNEFTVVVTDLNTFYLHALESPHPILA